MNDEEKHLFALAMLRIIAMSYRERFDRDDTPAYVLADEALHFLGDDVEIIGSDNDRVNELLRNFRKWRREQKEAW